MSKVDLLYNSFGKICLHFQSNQAFDLKTIGFPTFVIGKSVCKGLKSPKWRSSSSEYQFLKLVELMCIVIIRTPFYQSGKNEEIKLVIRLEMRAVKQRKTKVTRDGIQTRSALSLWLDMNLVQVCRKFKCAALDSRLQKLGLLKLGLLKLGLQKLELLKLGLKPLDVSNFSASI